MSTFKRLLECEYKLVVMPIDMMAGFAPATDEDMRAAGYERIGMAGHVKPCSFTEGFENGFAAGKAAPR